MEDNIFFDKRKLKYCGENVIIGKTVRIRKPQEVIIEDNVIIDDFTYIPCSLSVGSYTHIGANCLMVGGAGKITIGKFVNIVLGCRIVTGSEDYNGGGLAGSAIPKEYCGNVIVKPVVVNDHALLGCNTIILPGVIIPEGMSTGAFTLLTEKEYKSWSLYLGIPARFHCERDGTEMKEAAEKLMAGEIIK